MLFGNFPGAIGGLIVTLAYAFLTLWWPTLGDGRTQFVIFALGEALLVTATFAYCLIRAPLLQRNEARTRLHELEEERIPRIAITSRAGRSDHGSHPHLMWAELDVRNLSPALPLRDVEVRITDLRDEIQIKYAGDVEWPAWNALQVVWSPTNTTPNQFRLTIPLAETRSALVAYSDDSNGPPATFASPHAGGRRLTSGPNRMEVSVSSPASAPCHGVFYIECHPNYLGHLPDGSFTLSGPRATMAMEDWDSYVARSNQSPSPESTPGTTSSPSQAAS